LLLIARVLVVAGAAMLTSCGHNSPPKFGHDSPPKFEPTNPGETLVKTSNIARPDSLAVDSKNNLYVLDTGSAAKVVKIKPDGTQSTLGFGELKDPGRVSVDAQDNVYVADKGNYRVLRLNAKTGEVETLPSLPAPTANNGYAVVWDAHADRSGNLFALGNPCRLLVLKSGEPTWRTVVELPQCSAQNFTVDDDDTLYIAEDKGVIKVLSDGSSHERLPVEVTKGGPLGITIAKNGRLYITPHWGDTIYLYDRGGAQSQLKLTHLRPDDTNLLNAIAVDNNMNVYVAESLQNFIVKVAPPS
jgi:sugar lactone lactonase YvrE